MKGKLFSLLFAGLLVVAGSLLFVKGYAEKDSSTALIEADIQFAQAEGVASDKIVPGSKIILKSIVKNTGKLPSQAGEISINFSFPEPIANKGSPLFQTEKVALPSIEPGSQVEVSFKTPHLWPSVYDFIRNDWGLRRYQAVAVIDEKEFLIGKKSIAFTATYYPGPDEETPQAVPSK